MARAVSKAGSVVRQLAQRLSPSRATANGNPQQAQPGPSRKLIPLQQAAQNPACPTGARQAMQSGGNSRSRTALAKFPAMDAPHNMLSLASMPDLPNHKGPNHKGPNNNERPPLFDFFASV